MDIGEQDELDRLQDRAGRLQHGCELLQARLINLGLQIDAVHRRTLHEKRLKGLKGGANATKIQQSLLRRRIVVLEGERERVELIWTKQRLRCHKLKAQINELRKGRLMLRNVIRSLEASFQNKKKDMRKMIMRSNELYRKRADAIKQLELNQKKRIKDAEDFKVEMATLGGIISEQQRIESSVKMAALKRRAMELQSRISRGGMDPEEEARVRAKIHKLNARVEQNTKKGHVEAVEKMMSYEEAFQQITRHSGMTDLNILIEQFVTNEDYNFGLFEYIQRRNKETERLENELRVEIERKTKFLEEQDVNVVSRKKIKSDLEEKLADVQRKCSKIMQSNLGKTRLVEQLTLAADQLFHTLQCDKADYLSAVEGVNTSDGRPASSSSGALVGVNGFSLNTNTTMSWLGAIEQRALEILFAFDEVERGQRLANAAAAAADDDDDANAAQAPTGHSTTEVSRSVPVLPVKDRNYSIKPALALPDSNPAPEKPVSSKSTAHADEEEKVTDVKPMSMEELRRQAELEIREAEEALLRQHEMRPYAGYSNQRVDLGDRKLRLPPLERGSVAPASNGHVNVAEYTGGSSRHSSVSMRNGTNRRTMIAKSRSRTRISIAR